MAIVLAAGQRARAQNLVQDPNFSAGLTYYQSPYGYNAGATATIYDGRTGVELSGNADGYVQQEPIVGYTVGTTYLFTFLAAAIISDQPSTIYFGFGPTCTGECETATYDPTTTLTQFSLSGTAGSSSNPYIYIEASGGSAFVTGLDFEAAPAPVPGAGILSFCVLFAGLAIRRISAG